MKSSGSDWYSKIWSLDIKNQSWVENTPNEVDFIIEKLGLKGSEKILDLACGFGRHSLELARRGFDVTGVDITKDYVEDANKNAQGLNARFICSDIRNVTFENEFDVVLNLADGAIGYLENDEENLKIFDVITKALKKGGQSFIDVMSGDYADAHFPQKLWDMGEKSISLSVFKWDKQSRIMLYGQNDFAYGSTLEKPEFSGFPTRLYTQAELTEIYAHRGMKITETWCDYNGNKADENGIQLIVHAVKD